MNRRQILLASPALATVALPFRSIADIVLGSGTLTTVSDGTLTLPVSLPTDVSQEELAGLAAKFGLEAGQPQARPLNVTVWNAGDRLVLFDAGSGPAFVDSAGALYDNLSELGHAPEDITDVVFTHAHPDHIWGILDDFDEIAFPEADLWLGRAELDYWSDEAATRALDETRQFFAVGARRRLEAMGEVVQTFGPGDEILPGVTAMATYGHTPGHMSFRVSDGDASAVILGDAVTNDHLHFARPGWASDGDQDPETAAATRVALLAALADEGTRVIGYHLPGDGIGRVEADGEGYRFVPEDS